MRTSGREGQPGEEGTWASAAGVNVLAYVLLLPPERSRLALGIRVCVRKRRLSCLSKSLDGENIRRAKQEGNSLGGLRHPSI